MIRLNPQQHRARPSAVLAVVATVAVAACTGEPQAVLKDVDRDGDRDLVLTFSKAELTRNGDLAAATTKLVLLGSRTDGRKLRGSDAVQVTP